MIDRALAHRRAVRDEAHPGRVEVQVDVSDADAHQASEITRASSKPCARKRLDQLGRRLGVEGERHQRLAAAPRARDGHVRDVDARLAEERADAADHAGHVVVAEEDHQRRELHLELEAERAHEPVAVLVADRRPGGPDPLAVRADLDPDEVREVAARAAALLEHLDPALGRDQRGVHVVDRPLGPALEGAVQRGDGEQARVVAGEGAVVRERDPLGAARRRAPSPAGRASPRAG